MEKLTDEVKQDSVWTVIFANDIVICSECREQVEKRNENQKARQNMCVD